MYRKQGDSEKWLEHHAATNEWYVKPTADRNRAEGWMCLASDPPCRPEECRGVCEVWTGERWTVAESVTVLVSGVAFSTVGALDLFCIEETKSMLERLEASLARSLSILNQSSQTMKQPFSIMAGGTGSSYDVKTRDKQT